MPIRKKEKKFFCKYIAMNQQNNCLDYFQTKHVSTCEQAAL
jgi:hypothetical protein